MNLREASFTDARLDGVAFLGCELVASTGALAAALGIAVADE